ncbi:MAG: YfhO family protein [Candidatus Firestonebacteria bacterium]
MFPKKYSTGFIIFFLSILVVLFFYSVLFFDNTFSFRDFSRYFYPYKEYVANHIKNYDLPLWNPYVLCGTPIVGNLQANLFYPLSFIYYVLPFDIGINIFYLIHYLLAGILMYFLANTLKFSRFSSIFCAITFMFSGYLVSVLDMSTTLCSVAWLPLTFLFFHKMLDSPPDKGELEGVKYIVLTAISLAFQLLGGEPTILYGTVLLLIGYSLFRIIFIKSDKYMYAIKIFISLFGSVFLCFLLTAFQVFPFLEFLMNSHRLAGSTYESIVKWSIPPWHLITFFIPYAFGDVTLTNINWYDTSQMWLKTLYMGVLPLLFAIYAMIYEKKQHILFWIVMFLLSVFMVFGKYFSLYPLLYKFFPGISFIRYPVKFIFITTFCITILSGKGIDLFLEKCKSIDNKKYIKLIFFITMLFLFAIFLAYLNEVKILSFTVKRFFAVHDFSETLKLVNNYNFLLKIFLQSTIFLLLGVLIFLSAYRQVSLKIVKALILIILTFDLFLNNYNINPVVPRDFYKKENRSIEFTKKNSDSNRTLMVYEGRFNEYVYGFKYEEAIENAKRMLVPNWSLLFRLNIANGYESMYIKRYVEVLSLLFKQESPKKTKLLDLLNVQYVFALFEIKCAGLNLISKDKPYIYENTTFLPRAFYVPNALNKSDEEMLEELKNKKFDPTKVIMISKDTPLPKNSINDNSELINTNKVNIVEYTPEKVILNVHLAKNGYVFLSDVYYPGWKVFIDNVPSKILRANYAFRAVSVNKGKHSIEFIYSPLSFKIGLIVSTITLLLILLFTLLNQKLTKKTCFSKNNSV